MQIECGHHDIQVYFDHELTPRPHSPIALLNAISALEQELGEQACRQSRKADALAALGQLLILDQQFDRAKKSLEGAAMIYVDCGQLNCLLEVRLGLANVAMAEGSPAQAFDLVTDVLADIESEPELGYRVIAFITLARVHAAQGQYDHARQAVGAALEHCAPQQVAELQKIIGTIGVLENFGPVRPPATQAEVNSSVAMH